MRVEGGERGLHFQPRWGVGLVGVGFVVPVGELVGEAVVFSFFDKVELFGRVGVGAVFGGEELAEGIEAEAEGIAESFGEDFELGVIVLWIEPPDGGGGGGFAFLGEVGLIAFFAVVGARAAGDVHHSVGTLGDVGDRVLEDVDGEGDVDVEPGLRGWEAFRGRW